MMDGERREEEAMVHPGAYRGNKRQKELKRLQKQEEKRQRRLQKKAGPEPEEDRAPEPETPAAEGASGEERS
jgi:hypothetical protein